LLEHRIAHDGAVGRRVRSRGTDSTGAVAPNLFELSGGDVRTVISSNGSPELLATSFVDGAEAVGVDDFRLVSDFGVDAEAVVGLRRFTRSKGAWLGEENLVLGSAGRCGE
jgi:hypothetical protein